jgi:uncharacterized protein (DUF433 family)
MPALAARSPGRYADGVLPWQDRIVLDPQVLAGKPTIKGTRLSVQFVIDLLAQGWSDSDVVENHPGLTSEDVRACLQDASAVLAAEKVFLVSGRVTLLLRLESSGERDEDRVDGLGPAERGDDPFVERQYFETPSRLRDVPAATDPADLSEIQLRHLREGRGRRLIALRTPSFHGEMPSWH